MAPLINPDHCPSCASAALIEKLTNKLVALGQENEDLKSFIQGLLLAQDSRRQTINSN